MRDVQCERAGCHSEVLLGDCAHLVTPNTARGSHTALLDAQALRTSLSAVGTGASVDEALAHYNTGARERARALLEMGRARNARYLPPGGVQAAMRPADLLLRQQQARAGGGGSGARGGGMCWRPSARQLHAHMSES